jgi:hypothetical protein
MSPTITVLLAVGCATALMTAGMIPPGCTSIGLCPTAAKKALMVPECAVILTYCRRGSAVVCYLTRWRSVDSSTHGGVIRRKQFVEELLGS